MFDHVTIRVADREASVRFYELVLGTLGVRVTGQGEEYFQFGGFTVARGRDDLPLTSGLHVGFVADSPEAVRAFWQAGVDAGYASDGEAGPRPEYSADYYGGFLLDPDGNSVEAVHHGRLRTDGGPVDHVWMRVQDAAKSQAFYAVAAPYGGYALAVEQPGLARFRGPHGGSLTVVEDPGAPLTKGLHLAFHAAAGTGSVDAFHAAELAAGAPDHGAPGERAKYHPGYYGAFVLDPDGHNIEVVDRGPNPPEPFAAVFRR